MLRGGLLGYSHKQEADLHDCLDDVKVSDNRVQINSFVVRHV